MNNIYKDMYSESENKLNLNANPRIKIMENILSSHVKNKDKILDIGCYDGTLLSSLKNKTNELYGIEASDYGVQASIKKGIKVRQFFFNDVDQIPFRDNFFDYVIAGEIIEHIYDTDYFIKEVYRVLKPGGKLLLSTPNIASFGRRMALLFGLNPLIELSPNEKDSSGHIRYFTFNGLNNMLKKHKYKLILYQSDVVNFSNDGRLRIQKIASIFPLLGQSIIVLAEK